MNVPLLYVGVQCAVGAVDTRPQHIRYHDVAVRSFACRSPTSRSAAPAAFGWPATAAGDYQNRQSAIAQAGKHEAGGVPAHGTILVWGH